MFWSLREFMYSANSTIKETKRLATNKVLKYRMEQVRFFTKMMQIVLQTYKMQILHSLLIKRRLL